MYITEMVRQCLEEGFQAARRERGLPKCAPVYLLGVSTQLAVMERAWRLACERYALQKERLLMAKFRRQAGVAADAPLPERCWVDAAFDKDYPALGEYLSVQLDCEGKALATATLLVLCEEGLVKGCLMDRASERRLWRSHRTFRGLLEAMEKALAGDAADWRKPSPVRKR